MAVNQTKISDDLKALVSAPDQSEFIFAFMAAYGLPKATITHIRQGGSRNLAKESGHVGINSKFYFQPVDEGADIELLFEQRIAECASTKHKYRFVILTDFVRFLAWDVLTEEGLDTELGGLFREYGFFLPLAFGILNDLTNIWTSCFMLLFVLVSAALIWMHFVNQSILRNSCQNIRIWMS